VIKDRLLTWLPEIVFAVLLIVALLVCGGGA
jgi:hypothetical protein